MNYFIHAFIQGKSCLTYETQTHKDIYIALKPKYILTNVSNVCLRRLNLKIKIQRNTINT